MKTRLVEIIAVIALAIPALAQNPGPELVQQGVTAYNAKDITYFESHLADDVVWLDEDGHVLNGKTSVLSFLRIQFGQTPPRTLTVSDIRVDSTADAAWATFAYMIMGGDAHLMGLNTTVYKRVGTDWHIAVVHGAVNTEGHH